MGDKEKKKEDILKALLASGYSLNEAERRRKFDEVDGERRRRRRDELTEKGKNSELAITQLESDRRFVNSNDPFPGMRRNQMPIRDKDSTTFDFDPPKRIYPQRREPGEKIYFKARLGDDRDDAERARADDEAGSAQALSDTLAAKVSAAQAEASAARDEHVKKLGKKHQRAVRDAEVAHEVAELAARRRLAMLDAYKVPVFARSRSQWGNIVLGHVGGKKSRKRRTKRRTKAGKKSRKQRKRPTMKYGKRKRRRTRSRR